MVKLDWENLGFGYIKANYNVRSVWKDGKWGDIQVSDSERLDMHIAATCLHYGQEIFEGLKAYQGKDGKVRLFRWQDNATRMQESADGVYMEKVPTELFGECIKKVVELNKEFVPPYGTGASLYIRPLLIGTGSQIGINPSNEYTFIVFVSPVGPYFKNGFCPVDISIIRDSDRSAPLGTGRFKVGGNYAAGLYGTMKAKKDKCAAVLYLDAKEKKYIDECGPANFFGIKGNKFITPKSESILASITNKALQEIAVDMGMEVECRPVPVEELSEFDEAGACGTATVISPIKRIFDKDLDVTYDYCKDGEAGKVTQELYNRLVNIQYGDAEDKFGWIDFV